MKVAIIGGGIGGLTFALALKKANISFVIYEATKEIKPVGAGIALANNAMQVFDYLGVSEKLNSRGVRISTVELTDIHLNVFNRTDLTPFEAKYKLANIAIHRSHLHEVLMEEIGYEHINLGKRLENIVKKDDGLYEVVFEDQTRALHEYIIGADGIRSKVRQIIFGDYPLRDAKQMCWRGVLNFDLPEGYDNLALEGWGRGERFGFVKLLENQVYWYYLINERRFQHEPSLVANSINCAPLVQRMIRQTVNENIHLDRIFDLKPMKEWYKDKVCLLGDAAHATTPNLGQGACQAIEDVYIISKLLAVFSLDEALEKYPEIRRKKAHAVVNDSWYLGSIAQLENPLLVIARNALFQMLPNFVKNKQMQKMFELQKVKY